MAQQQDLANRGMPGRLGDPDLTLRSDPRCDPRVVEALAAYGLDGLAAPPPVDLSSSMEELHGFVSAAEEGFEAVFEGLAAGLPEVPGVVRSRETITGVDGNDIALYIHRPAGESGELPGVLQIHGGGQTILRTAGPMYSYWRDRLAATGMVAVGVEFRNGGGALGPHPFPAGLNDCSSALEWVGANKEELGVSKLIVQGDSGGANLTFATTLKAKRDGRLGLIDGVYGLSPNISGAYDWPVERQLAELPSLVENDRYFFSVAVNAILKSVYDPGAAHERDPLCWPYFASADDLAGLPPHLITTNELDPLRDEGVAYYRKLLSAGVSATAWTVLGTCHVGHHIFPGQMPELFDASVNAVRAFAASV